MWEHWVVMALVVIAILQSFWIHRVEKQVGELTDWILWADGHFPDYNLVKNGEE